jgi:hypothetical protein
MPRSEVAARTAWWVGMALDSYTTVRALDEAGVSEANPMMRAVHDRFGDAGIVACKAGVYFLLDRLLRRAEDRRFAVAVFWVNGGMQIAVGVHNWRLLERAGERR